MRKLLLVLVVCVLGSLSVGARVVADSANLALSLQRLNFESPTKIYVIGKLSAKGLTSMSEELLLSTTGISVGDSIPIPGDILSDVTRKLWDQRHFSDVKVSTDFRGDTVDVVFYLTERRRVTDWLFEGVTKTAAKALLEEKLKLRRHGELSPYQISSSLEKIREYYNEKGFRRADISYRVDPDSSRDNYVYVTFVVDRKKRVRIGDIKFEGNKNIASKKLAKAMEKTKKVSINFFADTKFKDADFPEDKNKVLAYYRSKGYRDAKILADSIFDINDKRIGIWIKVDEGKKYYYRNISWIGNAKTPTEYLDMLLQLKNGDTYDSETMGHRLGTIQSAKGEQSVSNLYRDDGYLAFRIEPVETVVGDSVDVEIRMYEGKQFTIKNVNFSGNTRTNDHVIRRELDTRPGDLFSQSLLIRSYQRLAQMGQFDAASFSTPDINPDLAQETVDISYSFTEVSNDKFELSGGWGAGMFIASVGVNFTNVSLRKFFDPKAWRPYPAGDNQTISVKVQSNGTYYQAASLSFTEPWLGGRKPTSLSVSFYTSRESDAYMIGMPSTKFFGTIGGSVSIGKRVNWPDPYFVIQGGLSFQTYNLKDWDYFVVKNGSSNTVALSFSVSRNSVDDPMMYPTRGSDISLSVTATPPFSLWDGVNYADKNLPSSQRHQWVEYHKWKFNARWFFPLTPDGKLVLMARAQYGYLGNYNKNKQSPFEGFQMGGDGLSGYSLYGVETVGLRGYENGTLTPFANSGLYANIYSKYTAELRYPIVKSEGTMVYALGFVEAGNAFTSLQDFKPFNLKRAAGVGVRVYLPVLGMLGVDWGYGFDAIPGSSTISGGQIHFSLGAQF